jgi:hypothetical protein
MELSNCITDNIWLDYSRNNLGSKDMDLVIKHVKICEICFDIKAGIDSMSNSSNLELEVSKLNNKVTNLTNDHKSKKPYLYWSAAAIVIFGVGLSWFVLTKNTDKLNVLNIEKSIYKRKDKSQYDTFNKKDLDIVRLEKPINKTNRHANKENGLVTEKSYSLQNESYIESMDDSKNLLLNDTGNIGGFKDTISRGLAYNFNGTNETNLFSSHAEESDKDNYSSIPLNNITANTDFETKSDDNKEDTKTESSKNLRNKVSLSSTKSKTFPAPANNSNDNLSLNKYFNQSDSSQLEIAYQYYYSNNLNDCLVYLQKVLSNSDSKYFEEALLLKAETLIKQKKVKEAKLELKKLISLNGLFREKAELMLKSLK